MLCEPMSSLRCPDVHQPVLHLERPSSSSGPSNQELEVDSLGKQGMHLEVAFYRTGWSELLVNLISLRHKTPSGLGGSLRQFLSQEAEWPESN